MWMFLHGNWNCKCGSFKHTFNLAAQRIITTSIVSKSAAKISVTNLASDQMWNMATVSTFVRDLWCVMTRKQFLQNIMMSQCGNPLTFCSQKCHYFLFLDICVVFCHSLQINSWDMTLNLVYEVTVNLDHQNLSILPLRLRCNYIPHRFLGYWLNTKV